MPDGLIDGDAKAQWLKAVLGFALPARAPSTPSRAVPDWRVVRRDWQAANEAVDGQIAALQAALRKSGDDELEEVAEFGLNGITGNHRVRLTAALIELGDDDAATLQKAGPKTLGLIDAFRSYLESSEAVEVCDGNPFDTPVAIRATLVPALAQLAAALQAAIKP